MQPSANYEAAARALLSEPAYHYFAGGAGDESALADNRAAFERTRLVPRVLRDTGAHSTETTVLGVPIPAPLVVAPLAYQAVAHPEGELALARGAAAAGAAVCLSTLANHSLEDVAAAAPGAPRFFQLYPYRDRGMTAEVIARAERAGYGGLVVTVDVPVHGDRRREQRLEFRLPERCALPCVPVPRGHAGPVTPADVTSWMRPDLGWDDIEAFREMSSLPVALKGVLHPADGRIAAEHGIAGVVISNHGGRQLDTAIAPLDALVLVAGEVGDRVELLIDGGVRTGVDVVKALACGARAVMVGRPVTWGLAAAGSDGVRHVLARLRAETEQALTLTGCTSLADVGRDLVRRPG